MVYVAVVLDAFSCMVVGWQLAAHVRTDLTALRSSLSTTPVPARSTPASTTRGLDDHGPLLSVGSAGDAYDNALPDSFVDSFKTELIAARVWRIRSQLELPVVEYPRLVQQRSPPRIARPRPAAEFEQRHAACNAATGLNPDDQSVASPSPRPAEPRTGAASSPRPRDRAETTSIASRRFDRRRR